MNEPTKKQEETIREFLHEAVVPLIEDVLVKKLGQAMSYAKEQLATSKPWVSLTDEERNKLWKDVIGWGDPSHDEEDLMKAIEAALRSKNNG